MAQAVVIKPTHKAIDRYYETLERLKRERVTNESSLRPAFQNLLEDTAKVHGWSFIADYEEYIVRLVGQVLRVSVETVKIVNALPKDYGGGI